MRDAGLDPQQVSVLAHAQLPVQAPLDAVEVSDLLRRVPIGPGASVVDVGCGTGGWISRLLELHPDVHVEAYDRSGPALEVARDRLAGPIGRGNVVLHEADVGDVSRGPTADLALNVGAARACGGTVPTLRRLRSWVKPDGRVLFGTECWREAPTEAARTALNGAEGIVVGPDRVRAMTRAAGFVVELEQVTSLSAWDRYEDGWVAGLDRAAEAAPEELVGVQLLSIAEVHERAYHEGYRGQLSFVTFVLRPA